MTSRFIPKPPESTSAEDAQSDVAVDASHHVGSNHVESKHVKAVRVLHVINGEHYSGAERVQDLLAARLPEFGYEVGFACVKPDRFPELRTYRQAPLYELGMRSKFDFRAAWRLVAILRDKDYRLIHAHTPRSAMVGSVAAMLAGVPLVYHVHSPTACDTTQSLRNWLNNTTERLSLTGASRLITVSASLGRHMERQGFRRDRIEVVPNGVPCCQDVPDRAPPRGTWTVGTVALFRPRKGTEVLLDALALLRQQGLPVQLRAIGPFESERYEQQLRQQARELQIEDAIAWTGFTSDVNAELAGIDLFVLPSLFGEGLPMVVLEAMAAGVPVVASCVEGIPEAIRDGQDGVIAAAGDSVNLARAIRRVVDGELDWSALRRSALERHAICFSDRAMAEGVAKVYRQLL